MLVYMAKETLQMRLNVEVGDYPGLTGWANAITGVLIEGGRMVRIRRCGSVSRVRGSKQHEDDILLTLKMKGRTTSHGRQVVSRRWKMQRNRFSPSACGGRTTLPIF